MLAVVLGRFNCLKEGWQQQLLKRRWRSWEESVEEQKCLIVKLEEDIPRVQDPHPQDWQASQQMDDWNVPDTWTTTNLLEVGISPSLCLKDWLWQASISRSFCSLDTYVHQIVVLGLDGWVLCHGYKFFSWFVHCHWCKRDFLAGGCVCSAIKDRQMKTPNRRLKTSMILAQ